MEVCCIVFDIDGMLFDFFCQKSYFFPNFVSLIFLMFSSCFMLFPTILEKKIRGGGVKKKKNECFLKNSPSLTG